MEERYNKKFEEVYSFEWNTLISNLNDYKHKINYHLEEDRKGIILYIEGVGKEIEPISTWIECLQFIERVLNRWYRIYKWNAVNHSTGVRIDIYKK